MPRRPYTGRKSSKEVDMDKIFRWTGVGAVLIGLLFLIHFAQSCSPIKNLVTVQNGGTSSTVEEKKIETPTKNVEDAIRKTQGPDAKIKGVISVDTKQGEDKSKRTKVSVVLVEDAKCNTCSPRVVQIDESTTFIGFSFRPKFYLGMTQQTPTLGYAQEFFRWGKVTSNLTLGFPSAGLGLGYDITNNFYGIAGANVRYMEYKEIGDISSYNVDTTELTKIYPMIGIGFYF